MSYTLGRLFNLPNTSPIIASGCASMHPSTQNVPQAPLSEINVFQSGCSVDSCYNCPICLAYASSWFGSPFPIPCGYPGYSWCPGEFYTYLPSPDPPQKDQWKAWQYPSTQTTQLAEFSSYAATFQNPAHRCGRVHTIPNQERKFVCVHPGCGKRYFKPSHLKAHLCVHTGERNCVCYYPFPPRTKKNVLQNYQGPICGARFSRSDALTRHWRKEHIGLPFQCPMCPKGFNRTDHLKNHINAHQRKVTENRDTSSSLQIAHSDSENSPPHFASTETLLSNGETFVRQSVRPLISPLPMYGDISLNSQSVFLPGS
ncbi:unnamed protein product [Calicophoron daubneyi]|uniref:C2H2-type domain-containing protein n=1 Tax=Calicophoron daubneyi TaxID=300641 RepID=A0AAV2T6N9_CALDB